MSIVGLDPPDFRTLSEFRKRHLKRLDVVRIECERCGRSGGYRREGLLARFGPDAALPDVLMALASRLSLTICRFSSADQTRRRRTLGAWPARPTIIDRAHYR